MTTRRVVFFGTPGFAVPSLRAIIDGPEQICAVVTQPDRPAGRGRHVQASPVKVCAREYNLPVLQPDRVTEPSFVDTFTALNVDLAVVVAFGQIFQRALLDIPRYGFINVHSSLLPAYRGAAPINRAIIDRCRHTGVTIMQLDEGMDTGDIILQEKTAIGSDDTAADLHDRLARLGADLLRTALDLLPRKGWTPVPQDHEKASYAPRLKKNDGLINWSRDAEALDAQVRGMTPWPGCVTYLNGKKIKIHKVRFLSQPGNAEPGTVCAVSPEGIAVAAGRGMLLLQELQLEGRKRLASDDFIKGFSLQPGMVFSGSR